MTCLQQSEPQIVHCGVDWITVTARGGDQAERLFDTGRWLSNEAVTRGNQRHQWSFSGFHGERVKGVQVGTREDEVIVRLSSDMAHGYWREVYAYADNISRLDVQATLSIGGPVGPTIRRHYESAKRHSAKLTKPSTLSVLSTNNGPSTVYFNKRISDRFGRIYDKGAESGHPDMAGCIRYEVELKGKAAKSAIALISSNEHADLVAALFALDFFVERGINLGKLQAGCEEN